MISSKFNSKVWASFLALPLVIVSQFAKADLTCSAGDIRTDNAGLMSGTIYNVMFSVVDFKDPNNLNANEVMLDKIVLLNGKVQSAYHYTEKQVNFGIIDSFDTPGDLTTKNETTEFWTGGDVVSTNEATNKSETYDADKTGQDSFDVSYIHLAAKDYLNSTTPNFHGTLTLKFPLLDGSYQLPVECKGVADQKN